jgi:hypothetical protein
MQKAVPAIIAIAFFTVSCASLTTVLESVDPSTPLTKDEAANGLKEALKTGARNAAARLHMQDGYFGDGDIRISLPEEAGAVVENLAKIPGGRKLVDDAVIRINRAAEDAAGQASPVFVNSIRQMSIGDAFGLLYGQSDAATQHLRRTTYDELFALYRPKIEASVHKPLIGNISTQQSWDALTDQWNRFASSLAGRLAGFEPVETDLGRYLTYKALDGLFLKIADEELKIRQNVGARVTPLLRRVFGRLDNDGHRDGPL